MFPIPFLGKGFKLQENGHNTMEPAHPDDAINMCISMEYKEPRMSIK